MSSSATDLAAPLLKNEWSKRFYLATGMRKPFGLTQAGTGHYRMPVLEENGGWKLLRPYSGPPIPRSEWEGLEYITYPSDPNTYFAPLTSATGETVMRGFWDDGKPDLDGIWTANAEKAPVLKRYIEEVECHYGRVQLLRQSPNSMRETRWGLHLDDNNRLNPETNGWVVRMWLELTDDPTSTLVLRNRELDRSTEVQIPLPAGTQAVVDSQRLYHGAHHSGSQTRYALITSFESTEAMDTWVRAQAQGAPNL